MNSIVSKFIKVLTALRFYWIKMYRTMMEQLAKTAIKKDMQALLSVELLHSV